MFFKKHKDLAMYKNLKSYKKIDRHGNVLEHWKLVDGQWKEVSKAEELAQLTAKLEALQAKLLSL